MQPLLGQTGTWVSSQVRYLSHTNSERLLLRGLVFQLYMINLFKSSELGKILTTGEPWSESLEDKCLLFRPKFLACSFLASPSNGLVPMSPFTSSVQLPSVVPQRPLNKV